MKETIVISVGGSLIAPDEIDVEFLKNFKSLLLEQIKKGNKFVIVCGGGKTCRKYQNAASKTDKISKDDLDWIGIHSTRLNAQLLRAIFNKHAHNVIVKNPTKKIRFKENVLVAAGWKPGFSTDFDSVALAKNVGARRIINLTNVDRVYTKDPKKFKDARPLDKISWKDFMKFIPKKWAPGMHAPFDPIASKKARSFNLEVIIVNGANIENLRKLLNGKDFVGTVIS